MRMLFNVVSSVKANKKPKENSQWTSPTLYLKKDKNVYGANPLN